MNNLEITETEANDIMSRLDALPKRLRNNLDTKVKFDPKIHIRLTCCDVGVLTLLVDTLDRDFQRYDIIYRGDSTDSRRGRNINALITGETVYKHHKVTHNFEKCMVNYGACMGRNVVKDAEFEGNIFECVDYIENFIIIKRRNK